MVFNGWEDENETHSFVKIIAKMKNIAKSIQAQINAMIDL